MYFTVGGREIRIRRSRINGDYYIKPVKGIVAKSLKGGYTTYDKAEQVLIRFLKSGERVLFKAVYPR